MKVWFKELVRKFLWLFASAKAKKAKAEVEAREALERVNKESREQEQKKRSNQFENYVQSMVDEGKKRGLNEDEAKKWAWKKIEKKAEKERLKGQLIMCTICKGRFVDHRTGGMVKNPDGKTYRHQKCGG